MKYDELYPGHERLIVSFDPAQYGDRLSMNSNLPLGKNYRRKINALPRARQHRITFFSYVPIKCAALRLGCDVFSFGLHMEIKHPRVLLCLATKVFFPASIS